jgi:hypothetical protein
VQPIFFVSALRIAYKNVFGKPEGRDHLEDLGICEKVILE